MQIGSYSEVNMEGLDSDIIHKGDESLEKDLWLSTVKRIGYIGQVLFASLMYKLAFFTYGSLLCFYLSLNCFVICTNLQSCPSVCKDINNLFKNRVFFSHPNIEKHLLSGTFFFRIVYKSLANIIDTQIEDPKIRMNISHCLAW